MPEANFSVDFQARLVSTTTALAVGTVLVRSLSTNTYVIASTAHRAGRSCSGVILQAGDPSSLAVTMQSMGYLPTAISGLGSGAAGPVRVSSAGVLERVTALTAETTDDVVGYCDTDGGCQVWFGGIGQLSTWGPTSCFFGEVDTDSATTTTVLSVTVGENCAADLFFTITGYRANGDVYRADTRGLYARVGSAAPTLKGTTPTALNADATGSASSDAWAISLDINNNTVRARVVGGAYAVTWRAICQKFETPSP